MNELVAGAAVAAGPMEDRSEWIRKVISITNDLRKIAQAFNDHEQRKQECIAAEADGTRKRFVGQLVAVQKINKGNNVVKGYLQFEAREDANNVDEDGYEYIETPPLFTPEGRFEYNQAMSLVGQQVMVYKKLIPLPNGRKARECVAIEAA